MYVVIAPDSFKGSLRAASVAAAIADGWRSVRQNDELVLLPQADGGEGTLDAISSAVPSVRHSVAWLTGPDGRPVTADWLELTDGTAAVELAQVAGLPQMASLDPLGATTRGLGELMLATGATRFLVGLGGSATTDGGAGALSAFSLPLPQFDITLLTDVTAPLLGPAGAAAVFAPQKGATPAQVVLLEERLADLAGRLGGSPTAPGAGAAGGTAYGLAAAFGARIVPGAAYLAELTGLSAQLDRADILITGEGRFDDQSLAGKLVGHLIALAESRNCKICVIAGQVGTNSAVSTIALTDLAGSVDAAMSDPGGWLRAAGARAAAVYN